MKLPIPLLPGLPGLPLLPLIPLRLRQLVPSPAGEPRVVVVTGASSGIGRATALQSAARGDHVVLVARRADVLAEVAEECKAEGASSALVVTTDVGDDAAVAELVEVVLVEHGRIDAVLHCAGVVAYGRTEEVPADVFSEVVHTNLLGTVNVARHVIPVLREQERGDLVLVGSLLGQIAVPAMTPYVVSKWAVRALARQLKIENSDLPHIHISHVSPGSVDTPIYDSALDSAGMVNVPPPPVISPERVARVVQDRLTHPGNAQTALSNHALVLAFNLVPGVYDVLVGPIFRAASQRRPAED